MKVQFSKSCLLPVICLLANWQAATAQKVILVGAGATVSNLPSAEQKAYNWALTHFGADAVYKNFSDIAASGLPASARVIWFHFEDDPALPTGATSAAATIGAFVQNGGGLLASGFATGYVVDAGVTAVAPSETINNDPAGPDVAWGVKPLTNRTSRTPDFYWTDADYGLDRPQLGRISYHLDYYSRTRSLAVVDRRYLSRNPNCLHAMVESERPEYPCYRRIICR